MSKPRVAVVGYGTIGTRVADGAARQDDMEFVGVVDVAPTLPIRALHEAGMPYKIFALDESRKPAFEKVGIPISGTLDDVLGQVDVILDTTPAGIGAKNKETYQSRGVKAIFQGGEQNAVADVFFHGYANYEKGLGQNYLKLTSCNTTGLIRAIDALDREVGIERIAITIVRRVADPGDIHRGLVDTLQIEAVPNHQALDLMLIMPNVQATGLLIHTPITHGHIINVVAKPKKSVSKETAIDIFKNHPRIRVVKIADGFNSNTAFFQYARHLGYKRADMYEIGIWEECVGTSGDDLMFAINIPQEAVTIPETVDGIRACTSMQTDRLEAVGLTNRYLGLQVHR